MTMKYLDKNVSAEFDEVVVTNAQLSNGILTFSRKNFYDDGDNSDYTIRVDLKDIKLRIYKLKTGESLDDYKGDSISDEKRLRRETHLFLEPVNNNDNNHETEGIYHEYIWDEEKGDNGDFEMLGSTYLNLEPLEGRMTNAESAIHRLDTRVSSLETNSEWLYENKVNKESGKSLIEDSKIIKLDGIQEGANKTIIDTEIKTSDNPVSNTAVKNALSNKVDKETGKSLMTDAEKTKLNGIQDGANKTVVVDAVTDGETKPVTSNAVYDYAQPIGNYLTSHQSLKTINNQSLVGTGNITIQASNSNSLYKLQINAEDIVSWADNSKNVTITDYARQDREDFIRDWNNSLNRNDTILNILDEYVSDRYYNIHEAQIFIVLAEYWNESQSYADYSYFILNDYVPLDVNRAGNLEIKESSGGSEVDLTNYVQKSQTTGLIKNDGTIDANTYALSSTVSSLSSRVSDLENEVSSSEMELTALDITYTNGDTDQIFFYTKPKTSNGG